MIKFNILFFLLLGPNQIFAGNEDMCSVAITVPKTSTALPVSPSYFISPDPAGKYVGIIANGNKLVDLETGGMTDLPGGVDPVYSPDGAYLTRPGGVFYNGQEIREAANNGESTESPKKVYDGGMEGVYQSLGVIQDGNKRTYRMIDDTDGVSFQDYERNGSSIKLTKKMSSSRTLCPEFSSDTPMLSKDGKYLSIYNKETLSTQIYNVEDNIKNKNKPCKLVLDLGFPTGKVSFDYGNNQIAFHVDSSKTQANYFSGISSAIRKDAAVMKIDIQKDSSGKETWKPTAMAKINLTKGKTDQGTGTYYPRFRPDGSIVTVVQHKSGMAEYSLDTVPAENMNFKSYKNDLMDDAFIRRCTQQDGTQVYAALALGALWAEICSDYSDDLRAKDLLFIPIGLDHYACKKLVNKMWNSNNKKKAKKLAKTKISGKAIGTYKKQDQLNNLTKKDLLEACPSPTNLTDTATKRVGTLVTVKPKNGAEVLEARCVGCHESSRPDRPFIDFDNPSMADINNMAQSVFSPHDSKKRMPPAEENELEDDEKAMLKKYFIDVLSGSKKWKRPF
ncbi:MAG: hypothetical protein HN576_14645 [Bacteriovoracaceae bacterium]|jgi:hypothetical protein|nr:hypothetical protein [Bacteriovoracaceae bacterium]